MTLTYIEERETRIEHKGQKYTKTTEQWRLST
jgi:hypothetical protein